MDDFSEIFFATYLALLGAMVLGWFSLVGKLFRYLNQNHPKEYEAIGRPSLLGNNNPKNNIAFLRFVFSKRPLELKDIELVRQCGFLRKYFCIHGALFAGFLILVGVGIKYS